MFAFASRLDSAVAFSIKKITGRFRNVTRTIFAGAPLHESVHEAAKTVPERFASLGRIAAHIGRRFALEGGEKPLEHVDGLLLYDARSMCR